MMNAEKIEDSLMLLAAEPDNESAWEEIEEVVTSEQAQGIVANLHAARERHAGLHDWQTVARLIELELAIDLQDEERRERLVELGRVYDEELRESLKALEVYGRAVDIGPEQEDIEQVVAGIRQSKERWRETVTNRIDDAKNADEPAAAARKWVAAADAQFRFGSEDADNLDGVIEYLEQALEADAQCRPALSLAQLVYAKTKRWAKLADVLEQLTEHGAGRAQKVAAAHRLAQLCLQRLSDNERASRAFRRVLEFEPNHSLALAFLVDLYSANEEWEHLIALYEDQLHAGGVKEEDEFGVWIQIAMLSWKTLEKPAMAEPYFEKVRRAQPSHAGMLSFFRETCGASGDTARLISVLTDAERALDDGDEKRAIMDELAGLAESRDNARKAIDQYKAIVRRNPDDEEARGKLKGLYLQTESYNALIELYRQELKRAPKDDKEGKLALLRDIADIYEKHLHSDTALLTVLSQILQLDEEDIDAVRGLIRVYESLNRWRDLLNMQQRLAELTSNETERINLLRAVARRWLEQFSNVQNAIRAYERLLEVSMDDVEAREKLVELYRKRRAWAKLYDLYEGQLDYLEQNDRTKVMVEMAKLAAERLSRGPDAIRLLKDVLDANPTASDVLQQLARLAERQKDHGTVAEVLERRADEAEDEKSQLAILQKLGVLYADKLDDPTSSNRAWRRVLDISPGHKRALRVLRKSYVAEKDWDGLDDLYRSQNDEEGLADFLSTTADRSKDKDAKVELSFLAAEVYTHDLDAPERAVRSYERILSADEGNVRAAQALLPLYEQQEKWSRLPGLYTALLNVSEDIDEKIEILHKIADVMGGPLANKAGALAHAKQAYELKSDEEGLGHLREWSKRSGDWSAFVDVVRGQLEADDAEGQNPLPASRRRELRLMLAEVYASEVDKVDEAAAMYRDMLEDDPDDEDVLSDFDQLLRTADRRDDLRWLFNLRVDRLAGDEELEVLEEWATVEEECFNEPERATELLQRVVDQDPGRVAALSSLSRLLIAAGKHAEAMASLTAQRDVSDGDDRLQLELRLAEIHLEELASPKEAFDACIRALDIEDESEAAIVLLERLLEEKATRAEVAVILEPLYATKSEFEKQATAIKVLLESEQDEGERLSLCQRLADVLEHELEQPDEAFEVLLNTLVEAPSEAAIWDRVTDLGERTGRPTDLAEAYRKHVGGDQDPDLPEELQLELCERAASLHENELGDAGGAIPYLARILNLEPGHEGAFGRMKQILIALEQWADLDSAYASVIKGAADDSVRAERLLEIANLHEQVIGDEDRAVDYLKQLIEVDPYHEEALETLERLYNEGERFGDMASLIAHRLESAGDDEAFLMHLQLVDLYLHSLEEPSKAPAHLEQAFAIRLDDDDARDLAEECLAIDEIKVPVAALLDPVYEAADNVRSLVNVLQIQLDFDEQLENRDEVLRRVFQLRDERLKDDPGAFETLCALMPLQADDPDLRDQLKIIGRRLGRYEAMVDTLLATSDSCSDDTMKGGLLTDAANLLIDRLEKTEEAEAVYRRVMAIDEDNPELVLPACKALASIYEERDAHADLAFVLKLQAKHEVDGELRHALLHRIGQLYEEQLEDTKNAVSAYEMQLEEEPGDLKALHSLERIHEQNEDWTALVAVLRRTEEQAEDGVERRRCMVKTAEVLASELGGGQDAIDAWTGVLDDFGASGEVFAALVDLYEVAEEWTRLAETFEAWLDISEDDDERIELLSAVGDVRLNRLDDHDGALEALSEVLLSEPGNEDAREAMAQLLEHEDTDIKRRAAETLGPLYEADGDDERLLAVRAIEVDCTDDPTMKLELLFGMLQTAEAMSDHLDQAYAFAKRGVTEAVAEPNLSDWLENAERLAEVLDEWASLATLFESVVEDIPDAEIQQSIRLSIADLARERLEQPERARKWYEEALEADGFDRDAMVALEELYEEQGDHEALLGILQRLAESAEPSEQASLLERQGELLAGPLERPQDAIEAYENLMDLEMAEGPASALEKLYQAQERHDDRAALLERQLADAVGQAELTLRLRLCQLLNDDLNDVPRALEELGEVFQSDRDNEKAIALTEGILESSEDLDERETAAQLLEPVYIRSAAWEKLQHVLEARAEGSQDPTEKRQLLRRLVELYEEQLEDYDAALRTAAGLLYDEPTERSGWQEVERLGPLTGDDYEKRVADIFVKALEEVGADDPETADMCRRTGELFDIVDDKANALVWYRRAFEFNPDSDELFGAIDELLTELEEHAARIEHYQSAIDRSLDDDFRLAALGVIAEIQRDGLGDLDEAIETYRAVLDIDTFDEAALDALAELYEKQERRDDLMDLYSLRSEQADTPQGAAPYQLSLARMLAADESTADEALDQWELVITGSPNHTQAIADLENFLEKQEDGERSRRIIDMLRPVYDANSNWKGLVALNEASIGIEEDVVAKVGLIRETALIWERDGADEQRAFQMLCEAFSMSAAEEETREELQRLADVVDGWDRVAGLYTTALEEEDDEQIQRELLFTLAAVYDELLDDPRQAIKALSKLTSLDPEDQESLDRMETLCTLLSDWEALVEVFQKQAATVDSDEEAAELWLRSGSVLSDMLERAEDAIDAFKRVLDFNPNSTRAVDELIALHDGPEQRTEKAELLEQRIEITPEDDEARRGFVIDAADCYQSLEQPEEAIRVLELVVAADPSDVEVLEKLAVLFEAQEQYEELLDNLKMQATVTEDAEARRSLRKKVGLLYVSKLESPAEALEQYALVLEEQAEQDDAIDAVLEIAKSNEELRLDAASLLEPVLSELCRFEALVEVMSLRLSAQTDMTERVQTLKGIALVAEEQLDDPKEARAQLLQALAECADSDPIHDDIARLCELIEDFRPYADALSRIAEDTYDAVLQSELYERLGLIAEEELEDLPLAIEAYQKASEQAEEPHALYEALDRLYGETEQHEELARVLENRAEIESDDGVIAGLYFRLAVLRLDKFEDPSEGLAALRMAVDHDPKNADVRARLELLTDDEERFEECAEALETIYRVTDDKAARTALRNKRIGYAPTAAERVRLRIELAQMLEDESFDTKTAQEVIEKALFDDLNDPEVISQLERLATLNAAGTEGAQAWSSAAERLTEAIAAGLKASDSGDEERGIGAELARDLFLYAAAWQRDHLDDGKKAEASFLAALKQDPQCVTALTKLEELQRDPGREAALIETLRGLADLADDGESDRDSSELRREAKVLAETVLQDEALVEAILRDMLRVNENDEWALAELAIICEHKGDRGEYFSLLMRQLETTVDPEQQRDLRHQAAAVAADDLDNLTEAVDLYEQAFDDDPTDTVASDALRELYAKLDRTEDMLRFIERLIDQSNEPQERVPLLLESARLCIDKLDAPSEAIEHLHAALVEQPGHSEVVKTLLDLLQEQGRDDERADVLTQQIEIAQERGDLDAELDYQLRAAELYETVLNDVDRAVDTYLAILDRNASYRPALHAVARLYEQEGQHTEAADMYERLVEDAPADERAVVVLKTSALFRQVDDPESAVRVLQEALSSAEDLAGSDRVQIEEILVDLYRELEQWLDLADLFAGQAERSDEEDEKLVLLQRASEIHSEKREDPVLAAEMLEKALELKKEDRGLMMLLSDAYTEAGRVKDSIAVLEDVVSSYHGRRSKELAEVHHRIARAHLQAGDDLAALQSLKSARKIDPGSVAIQHQLGLLSIRLYDEAGSDEDGAAFLKQANDCFTALLMQRLDGDSPVTKAEVFFHLAQVKQRDGDVKQAILKLERALANDSSLTQAQELLAELKS